MNLTLDSELSFYSSSNMGQHRIPADFPPGEDDPAAGASPRPPLPAAACQARQGVQHGDSL